jgi:hypothetical protein
VHGNSRGSTDANQASSSAGIIPANVRYRQVVSDVQCDPIGYAGNAGKLVVHNSQLAEAWAKFQARPGHSCAGVVVHGLILLVLAALLLLVCLNFMTLLLSLQHMAAVHGAATLGILRKAFSTTS